MEYQRLKRSIKMKEAQLKDAESPIKVRDPLTGQMVELKVKTIGKYRKKREAIKRPGDPMKGIC